MHSVASPDGVALFYLSKPYAMPFYSQLQIGKNDSSAMKIKKRRVIDRIRILRAALGQHIASSTTNNGHDSVKIATWNLREFGKNNYGGRSFEARYYIAEIIAHFDIVALQEIRSDLVEFFRLKKILGPDWSYLATDVTDGSAGNGERMIFLYNRRKVQFRNISGELTLPEGAKIRAAFGERIKLEHGLSLNLATTAPDLSGTYKVRLKTSGGNKKLNRDLEIPLPPDTTLSVPIGSSLVIKKGTIVNSPGKGKASVIIPRTDIDGTTYGLRFPENSFDDSLRQFARTPFISAFQSGWLKINLCTVHIYYGDADDALKMEQRRSEIEQLTKALADKAKKEFKYDNESFMGVLGDFNIAGKEHPTMEALESNDFEIPEQLKSISGSNVDRTKFYDQIAFWKPGRTSSYTRLDILGANTFDFFEHVFKLEDEAIYRNESTKNGLKPSSRYKTWRTYKMSDHLPMWIELRTDFTEEYLEGISED